LGILLLGATRGLHFGLVGDDEFALAGSSGLDLFVSTGFSDKNRAALVKASFWP
jgi:hypothetical protein